MAGSEYAAFSLRRMMASEFPDEADPKALRANDSSHVLVRTNWMPAFDS
ncbi:MAG TPA: hypothetical protein VI670_12235 [Thermoanaerobaculia bacterium]|jgi:hypothetical protein